MKMFLVISAMACMFQGLMFLSVGLSGPLIAAEAR